MKLKHAVLVMIFVLFASFGSTGFLDAAIKKGPWLMLNGNNSTQMTVLWQTDVTQSCSIEWGTSTSYGSSANTTETNTTDHIHKYVISSLSNSTKYYYRVNIAGTYYTGSFRSVPGSSETNVKLFAYADTRSYPANHAKVAGRMTTTYTSDPLFQTIALFSGDYAYGDTESYWASEFFPRTQANLLKFQSEVPIMPCRGNHEGTGTQLKKYYPYPYVSGFYYSFDYGPVHVAVVDQNPNANPMISTTQRTWLSNDLAGTTKKWKIVCFHSPGWSAGGGHENDTEIQNYIQPILVQNGVSLVFCGDNHYYARAVVDNIHHITTGGGGAPLYNSSSSYPYIVSTEDNYEFCKIDVQGGTLYFTAVDYLGNTIDSFSIVKETTPSVTADFTYTTSGLTANFTDKSTASNTTITSWLWSFGDSSTSTSQNPSHTYAAYGTYNVTLTVSNGAGVSNSTTKAVTLSAPTVTANFTFTTSALTANFTDTSTASGTTITTWSWNFGDSTTSTVRNPSHTYAAAGTYNVTLTVSNGAGISNSITKAVTVTATLPYCASKSNSYSYEYIKSVKFGSVTKTSTGSYYSDFTATVFNMTRGSSVSFTLTPGFSGSSYTEYWKVWIDYNKDGDFADSGEQIYAGSGKTAKTSSFTVSSSASTGSTRMRVSMKYGSTPTYCETFAEGEVEDYTANIQ